MAKLSDAEIEAAFARGHAAATAEPRAVSISYEDNSQSLVVVLSNGVSISVPKKLVDELGAASPAQLRNVKISGRGYGLHWEDLDVDLSVPGLVARVTGTRSHMAREAGKSRSRVKALAARKNGAKGGRPRKTRAA
jgi:hypothetical protein